MSVESPVADRIDYEVLSWDTVRQMHQKFMAEVEEKAKKSISEYVPEPNAIVDLLKGLLIACARKAIEIKSDELADIVKGGKKAIEKRTLEVQETRHTKAPLPDPSFGESATFSKKQELEQALAKRRRSDDPTVCSVFGEEDRIYLRLTGTVVSKTQKKIAKYLGQEGYRITDYNRGYATDEKGKQQFKIGKLLKDNETLYKGFMDDPTRTSDKLLAVISRNADDIARMSTGRAWVSCMGSGGWRYSYVPKDIQKGSLIAYLVSEKDPDIVNPLARIMIKPFRKEEGILTSIARAIFGRHPEPGKIFVPGHLYGIGNNIFSTVVKKFVEEKLNRGKEGAFRIVGGLYKDSLAGRQVRKNEKTKPDRRYN